MSKKLKPTETKITDPTAVSYRLKEKEAADRVAEFANNPNPAVLESEIALCRLLVERAVRAIASNSA